MLESVRVMTPDGEVKSFVEELDLGYRHSASGARIYRFIGADPSGER